MKNGKLIWIVALVTLCALAAFNALSGPSAGPYPIPPKPVSIAGLGNANLKSNQLQYVASQLTNNVFSSSPTWLAAQTGWLTNSDNMGVTNGVLFHAGGAGGFIGHAANTPFRGNSRYRSTLILDSRGIPQAGALVAFGFSSNTPAGTLPADNSTLFGIVASQSSGQWGLYRNGTGVAEGSFGNINFFPGTNYVCISSDASNISYCVLANGHTNEFRANVPWANITVTGLTNFIAGFWAGTNGGIGSAGGRITASQTINPRLGVEDQSDFVTFSVDANVGVGQSAGDTIRLVIPAQYDSATNIGNLMVFCHGDSGSYKNDYEGAVGDEPTNGESVITYFNTLSANNYILASYAGDAANVGKQDCWGTSNSTATIDALIAYVRQRYAFSNIFLWGESAGGATALNYAASRHEKIAGILMNHACYSPSNLYNASIDVADINTAYGGSTAAQLATVTNANGFISGDPRGLPPTAFYGIPIRCTASTNDTTVVKTNNTDLLVTLLGGQVGQNIVGTPMSPEIDDFPTAGFPAQHGSQCYTTAVLQGDLAFLARCAAYAALDSSAVGGDMTVSGGLIEKGNNISIYSNGLPLTVFPGGGKLWLSNYDLYWSTPLKTNPVALGH